MRVLLLVSASLLLLGCGRPAHGGSTLEATDGAAARLVVTVIVDQLGVDTFERLLPALSEEGFFRWALDRGAYHSVRFEYAGTYTAPGHAAVHTGAPPAVSGIPANQIYDRARRTRVGVTDDGEHAVIGVPDHFASPRRLRTETVADVLLRETHRAAKVVALAAKERSAILPGGRRPSLVLFYEPRVRGYTTSRYYAQDVPAWVETFSARHPLDALLSPWDPRVPDDLARRVGIAIHEGEGDWDGLGAHPPHDPRMLPDPWAALPILPSMTDHLFALAREVVVALELGADDVPDLLSISVAGTDYAGHVFGPHSIEYLDHLRTADLALASFVRWLSARTKVAVVVTSDHGVAPLPERTLRGGRAAGRIAGSELVEAAESAAADALGEGPWVEAFVQPFLYLTDRGRDPAHRTHAVTAIREALVPLASVEAVFDVNDASALRRSDDAITRSVGLSIDEAIEADLFVVPAPGFVVDEQMPPGKGTSHGSPWPYDTDVPFVAIGPGVRRVRGGSPLPQSRVAASIATLLGRSAPADGDPRPLPGIAR